MPFYEFLNNESGTVETHTMKICELGSFMENNPQLQRHHSGPTPFGDPWRLGITKPDTTFEKYVIGRMKEAIPGNRLSERKTRPVREF